LTKKENKVKSFSTIIIQYICFGLLVSAAQGVWVHKRITKLLSMKCSGGYCASDAEVMYKRTKRIMLRKERQGGEYVDF